MAERLRLDEIKHLDRKGILFDANIWLYLYCPLGGYNPHIISVYSRCYSDLLRSSNTIFTDVMILSEVANRYLRLAFERYKRDSNQASMDYKRDYRAKDDYRTALGEIHEIIKNKILAKTDVCNSQYTRESLSDLIDETNPEIDFNDQHIVKICKDNGLYLLTNDVDFKNAPVDIVSHNRALCN